MAKILDQKASFMLPNIMGQVQKVELLKTKIDLIDKKHEMNNTNKDKSVSIEDMHLLKIQLNMTEREVACLSRICTPDRLERIENEMGKIKPLELLLEATV